MSKLTELKQEADDLGVSYSPNIGVEKLQAKIKEAYEAQETSSKELENLVKEQEKAEPKEPASGSTGFDRRKLIADRERAARKTKVITIIDNDQRVNNQTTSCVVNCGNEYFDLGTVVLPLNMDVEVMQGHIDVLKSVKIPQHVKNPKNGLSEVVMRNRYTISYSENQPK